MSNLQRAEWLVMGILDGRFRLDWVASAIATIYLDPDSYLTEEDVERLVERAWVFDKCHQLFEQAHAEQVAQALLQREGEPTLVSSAVLKGAVNELRRLYGDQVAAVFESQVEKLEH